MTRKSISVQIVMTAVCLAAVFGFAPNESAAAQNESLKSLVSLPAGLDQPAVGMINERESGRNQLKQGMVADSSGDPEDIFLNMKQAISEMKQKASRGKVRFTDAQQKNFRSLAGSDAGIRVQLNPDNGTPVFIKFGKKTKRTGKKSAGLASSRETARAFLGENSELLKLSDPDAEMKIKKEWTDEFGTGHFRFQQTYKGLPVWAREVSVHLDAEESVYLFQGRYEPTPDSVDTTAKISSDQAILAAAGHMNADASSIDSAEAELVIFTAPDGKMTVAYKIEISVDIDERWLCFIDAKDGSFLHRVNMIFTDVVTASALDLNSVNRSFSVWSEGGTQYLVDPSIPLSDPPYSPVPNIESYGNAYILDARNGENDLFFMTNEGGWDRAGVSAAYNIGVIHDYYKNTFNRNGIDDANMNYLVVVHFKHDYANAFWNGKFVVFGDGDNNRFSALAESLDVTAHEIQHGVTEHTAGLIYENQSGALNEAFSDIFACMVDRDDWTVGEDITLMPPGYLRNLADPSQGLSPLPSTMSEYRNLPNTESGDYGGVHINMTIPARAAYLIAEGLDSEGLGTSIGRDKTERIFYRALTTYLQASSQFLDARVATIQAAEDLHGQGSAEAAAVQAAWDAVEVYDGGVGSPTSQAPTATDAISGQDIMLYLFPRTDVSENYDVYDLYYQIIPDPFTGYDPNLDSDDINQEWVRMTRPAALTMENGTAFFYVSYYNNLWAVAPDGTNSKISDTNDIWSFAISPDGRYFAYTTNNADDNNIYVGDLETGERYEYPAMPESDLPPGEDSEAMSTIFYVSALSFDYTGRIIVFDALNCLSTPDNPCSLENGGYQYWSIGMLDLNDGTFEYPFPNQSPDFDLEYPAFAYNNNYVIALDVNDHSEEGTVTSTVWSMNWKDQTSNQIIDPNFMNDGLGGYGAPSFWGDDDYVTVQARMSNGYYAYRVPVDADWAGYPSSAELLNDYPVVLPAMHRAGVRTLTGAIETSVNSMDFGTVEPGNSLSGNITLTNSGNRDVNISHIAIEGTDDFTHNGTNALLPRNQSMTVNVTFAPKRASGSTAATLIVNSDADNPQTRISLTGNAQEPEPAPTPGQDGDSDGGGGGGCFIDAL